MGARRRASSGEQKRRGSRCSAASGTWAGRTKASTRGPPTPARTITWGGGLQEPPPRPPETSPAPTDPLPSPTPSHRVGDPLRIPRDPPAPTAPPPSPTPSHGVGDPPRILRDPPEPTAPPHLHHHMGLGIASTLPRSPGTSQHPRDAPRDPHAPSPSVPMILSQCFQYPHHLPVPPTSTTSSPPSAPSCCNWCPPRLRLRTASGVSGPGAGGGRQRPSPRRWVCSSDSTTPRCSTRLRGGGRQPRRGMGREDRPPHQAANTPPPGEMGQG